MHANFHSFCITTSESLFKCFSQPSYKNRFVAKIWFNEFWVKSCIILHLIFYFHLNCQKYFVSRKKCVRGKTSFYYFILFLYSVIFGVSVTYIAFPITERHNKPLQKKERKKRKQTNKQAKKWISLRIHVLSRYQTRIRRWHNFKCTNKIE